MIKCDKKFFWRNYWSSVEIFSIERRGAFEMFRDLINEWNWQLSGNHVYFFPFRWHFISWRYVKLNKYLVLGEKIMKCSSNTICVECILKNKVCQISILLKTIDIEDDSDVFELWAVWFVIEKSSKRNMKLKEIVESYLRTVKFERITR